jgi:hypothetical protein
VFFGDNSSAYLSVSDTKALNLASSEALEAAKGRCRNKKLLVAIGPFPLSFHQSRPALCSSLFRAEAALVYLAGAPLPFVRLSCCNWPLRFLIFMQVLVEDGVVDPVAEKEKFVTLFQFFTAHSMCF